MHIRSCLIRRKTIAEPTLIHLAPTLHSVWLAGLVASSYSNSRCPLRGVSGIGGGRRRSADRADTGRLRVVGPCSRRLLCISPIERSHLHPLAGPERKHRTSGRDCRRKNAPSIPRV